MVREPRHLREVTHGGFRHIRLPVCICSERSRRAEGKTGFDIWKFLRVEREPFLCALDQVQKGHGNAAKQEHRDCVFRPPHFPMFINAGQPIYELFDRAQQRIKEGLLAIEHPRHEDTYGLGEEQNHQQIKENLKPTISRHSQNCSAFRSA